MQDADALSIVLTPLDGQPGGEMTWNSNGSSLVVDLGARGLRDGDYELSLKNGTRLIQQTTLRLRSSNTPDTFTRQTAAALGHDMTGDPLAGIRAVPLTDPLPATIVRDLRYAPGASAGLRSAPLRGRRAGIASRTRLRPRPPSWSHGPTRHRAIMTGAHRIALPTFYGRPTSAMVSGVCTQCGLVKRYPARYSARRSEQWSHGRSAQPATVADVRDLPPVQHHEADWTVAFDSVAHLGGGRFGLLEQIAWQVQGTRLFVDEFSRSLEVRGDLEIRRRPDLTPDEWELSPAVTSRSCRAAASS